MQVVILCGGLGTRLGQHTDGLPKPMVEVGGRPLLWWIMRHYAHYGYKEFVLALGHKGWQIKDYFLNYLQRAYDFTMTLYSKDPFIYNLNPKVASTWQQDWRITFAETGQDTQTGGRLKLLTRYLPEDQDFLLTYGDGLSDVDIAALVAYHQAHGQLGTVTAVPAPGRFGELKLAGDTVTAFHEKPTGASSINGGFFVFQRAFLDKHVPAHDASCVLEERPLEHLARSGQLRAFRHEGFWQCCDTPRDLERLNTLARQGTPPWQVWR